MFVNGVLGVVEVLVGRGIELLTEFIFERLDREITLRVLGGLGCVDLEAGSRERYL